MKIDITAYLVIGPENTNNRPVEAIVKSALQAGFTCVQLRSKTASAKDFFLDIKQNAGIAQQYVFYAKKFVESSKKK